MNGLGTAEMAANVSASDSTGEGAGASVGVGAGAGVVAGAGGGAGAGVDSDSGVGVDVSVTAGADAPEGDREGRDIGSTLATRRQRRAVMPVRQQDTVPDPVRARVDSSGAVKIPAGAGTALGEIPNVAHLLGRAKNKDEGVKALHRLLFTVIGKEPLRKKHIRDFHGFPPEYPRKRLQDRAVKLPVATLRAMAQLLDLPFKGLKESLVQVLAHFLCNPVVDPTRVSLRASHDEGSKKTSGSKRKRDTENGESGKRRKKDGRDKETDDVEQGEEEMAAGTTVARLRSDEEIRLKIREIMGTYSLGELSKSKTKALMEQEWGCNLDDRMELIRACIAQDLQNMPTMTLTI